MKWKCVIFAIILTVIPSKAQELSQLPKLPADSAIKTFYLSNGVKCFFASNLSGKGLMDISLVQKMDPSLPDSTIIASARKRFAEAAVGGKSFESFLYRNGIMPDRNGYIITKQGSIQYDFKDCSLVSGQEVTDSTLMGVFSLMNVAVSQGQPSSSQAIVVAGDFDTKAMSDKFRLLGLMCPAVEGEIPAFEYKWNPVSEDEGGAISFEDDSRPKVVVRFRGARTPVQYMSTVLPVISDKMAGEFAWVLESRLYPVFRSRGFRVWINCQNSNSADGLSDEVITLSVYCRSDCKEEVRDILKTELDRLMTFGLDEVEYTYARDAYRYRWLSESKRLNPSNALLVKRCVSSFLYGSSLSSEESKIQFAYRQLSDKVQTSLFNKYMRKKLVGASTVDNSLSRSHPLATREATGSVISSFASTLSFKAPKDKSEYLSGGQFWTFPNGINVVYKKMDTRGMFYYSYSSRGGRASADPACFTCLDGVYEESFSNFLSSQGIEMKSIFNPCDVKLEGKVPEENVETMLHVLAALSRQEGNAEVFSSKCYKLLVLIGNQEVAAVKKILSDQISSLGAGGRWLSGDPVEDTGRKYGTIPGVVSRQVSAAMDVSTFNQARADIAEYVLRDAVGRVFDGCGVQFVCRRSFSAFPLNRFNVNFGVRPLPLEQFANNECRLDETQSLARLSKILEDLSTNGISVDALATYKRMARNAYQSYTATPEYYLFVVTSRYMDNKNPYSNYFEVLDGISPEDLRDFFSSLL